MSFIVEQEIKGQIYIYLSTAYWDKDKKQARQKRICLGKKDPDTGNIIPAKKNTKPESCKDFGNFYLLNSIAKKIGLTDALKKSFPNDWEQILAYAFCEASERTPMYLCKMWIENTYTEFTDELTLQRVSDFFENIGNSLNEQRAFYKIWTKKHDDKRYIFNDITSISSYSEISWDKVASNSQKVKTDHINLGIMYGQPSKMPIFYDVYKGSVRDFHALKTTIKYTNKMKVTDVRYMLDEDFFSIGNIKELSENGLKFVISLPLSENKAQGLVKTYGKAVQNQSNIIKVSKQELYGLKKGIRIGTNSLHVYIYFDKKVRDKEEEKLIKKLNEIQNKINQREFTSKTTLAKHLRESFPGYEKLLNIIKNDKYYIIKENKEAIKEIIKLKGFLIIISNFDSNPREILSYYSKREVIENVFDNMKNELDMKYLEVHSKGVMKGRLFIGFISLILYSWVNNLMIEKNLYKEYTVDEVMQELKKIKIVELGNDIKLLTKLTKKQKELFKIFGISIPINA